MFVLGSRLDCDRPLKSDLYLLFSKKSSQNGHLFLQILKFVYFQSLELLIECVNT